MWLFFCFLRNLSRLAAKITPWDSRWHAVLWLPPAPPRASHVTTSSVWEPPGLQNGQHSGTFRQDSKALGPGWAIYWCSVLPESTSHLPTSNKYKDCQISWVSIDSASNESGFVMICPEILHPKIQSFIMFPVKLPGKCPVFGAHFKPTSSSRTRIRLFSRARRRFDWFDWFDELGPV